MEDLVARFNAIKSAVDKQLGQLEYIIKEKQTIEHMIEELSNREDLYSQANAVLNSIGEQKQESVQKSVEALVTKGLQAVFSDDMSFHLVPSVRGSAQVIDFVIRTKLTNGEYIETSVIDSCGGGVVATVGFLLRVVMLLLKLDGSRDKILFLDEIFSHLSGDKAEAMSDFIRELCDKTDIRVVMVTHDSTFAKAADRVYRFSLVNQETKVTEISNDMERELYE